jgi:hypothetical protein
MFVVFATIFAEGVQIFDEGFSPQNAWENLLTGHDVTEAELDMENVRFFEMVNPDRVSMVTTTKWVLDSESE